MLTIEEKRKELNLTQEDVAAELGISRQYYNSVENFKKTPTVSLAKEIEKVLGVKWTIFFEDKVNV
jgi:putative transcriptional regulator